MAFGMETFSKLGPFRTSINFDYIRKRTRNHEQHLPKRQTFLVKSSFLACPSGISAWLFPQKRNLEIAIFGRLQTLNTHFMNKLKTIYDGGFKISEKVSDFDYQKELTPELDKLSGAFTQETINEIVLWKVNRYASVDENTLELINSIDAHATDLDEEKTKVVLKALIKHKGIQLPMASAILRFRNKNVYQIIDQRVFRVLYKDEKLKLKTQPSEKNLNDQVDLYIQYLKDLKEACKLKDIRFEESDRILFMADRRINKGHKLEGY
jgi:hypothetical protein